MWQQRLLLLLMVSSDPLLTSLQARTLAAAVSHQCMPHLLLWA
jgi:hypothetical protein